MADQTVSLAIELQADDRASDKFKDVADVMDDLKAGAEDAGDSIAKVADEDMGALVAATKQLRSEIMDVSREITDQVGGAMSEVGMYTRDIGDRLFVWGIISEETAAKFNEIGETVIFIGDGLQAVARVWEVISNISAMVKRVQEQTLIVQQQQTLAMQEQAVASQTVAANSKAAGAAGGMSKMGQALTAGTIAITAAYVGVQASNWAGEKMAENPLTANLPPWAQHIPGFLVGGLTGAVLAPRAFRSRQEELEPFGGASAYSRASDEERAIIDERVRMRQEQERQRIRSAAEAAEFGSSGRAETNELLKDIRYEVRRGRMGARGELYAGAWGG